MNAISLTVLGCEIFVLRLPDPSARHEPEPAPEAVEPEPEEDKQFGFHGGSGCVTESAWADPTARPIDTH